ncbi:hypothetical protein Rumeso_04056 [Rubellimicrobium mesophilum DSM 19309]|uniref:Uncharacterized protein n=1 Tax=Rubellimicrobium mesophilum DSM 19309 TaxID=442562 RepID=A0A017HJ38_9RHOB|nr:DUF6634 family protein [Rubellimicrobium mesophilum]EYD74371.1 hypothetical protein Rumeso_04056 [Rubellimicrobium mesophilum DSM 19309]
MVRNRVPVAAVPLADLLAALDALQRATEPPLTDPDVPVRLVDLPSVWQAYLHDDADTYADLAPPHLAENRRMDWTRLLARIGRQFAIPYQTAEVLTEVGQGPTPEDLDREPIISPCSPALDAHRALVIAGHVTHHPRLGVGWMRTSLLMGLNPKAGWARSWRRWYALGEPMAAEERPLFWQRGVAAEPIGTDDPQVAQHFADLRPRAAELLGSMAHLAPLLGEGQP